MAYDLHSNFSYSTVATAPSPATSGTSLVVASGQGSRFPTAPFNVVVWPANQNPVSSNAEIMRVTAVSTDTLTITRTQESTSARSIQVGDQIATNITAKWFTDIETIIPNSYTQGSVLFVGTSGVHSQDNANFYWDNSNIRLGLGTIPSNPLHLVKNNLASAAAALFDVTQTAVNTTDTSDAGFNLKYNLSLSSASNELIARIFKLDFTNTLTGGGAITNARVLNIATNTAASTTTTSLEAILIETGTTSGTVTTGIGLRIATLQGSTKWGIKDDSGGNWTLTGQIQASPGGASTPGYAFNTGTGEGMYRAASQLLFAVSGVERLKLTTSSLTLSTAGSALILSGSSSGTTSLAASATASGTLTLPAATDTLVGRATTDTLTNKRVSPRTGTTTSSATPTINTDNLDFYSLTAQAVDITSFTTNLTGTPTEAQKLWIAITGTAARAITWGTSFESGAATLPTTTVSTTRLDVGFIWNTVSSKWRCTAQG